MSTMTQVAEGLRNNAADLDRMDMLPMLAGYLRNAADAIDAHLAQTAKAVDVGTIREVIESHVEEAKKLAHDPESRDYLHEQANKLTRALSGEKAGPVDGWPQGCMDANSCARHRACMYDGCRHAHVDIGPAIDAASPAPDKEGNACNRNCDCVGPCKMGIEG